MKKVTFKNNQGVAYWVLETEDPTQVIAKETADQLSEGMTITVEVQDITYQKALAECHKNRAANYPDIGQIVEAILENDQQAINALKQQRALVKAQFPKPNNPNQGNNFASNEEPQSLMGEPAAKKKTSNTKKSGQNIA